MEDIELSRRGFLQLSGGALSAIGGGTLTQLQQDREFQNAALLIGPEANQPDPVGDFFTNKERYHYLYIATDTGGRFEIKHTDSDWSLLDLKVDNATISTLLEAAQANITDGAFGSATVNGKPAFSGDTTSSASPGFGSWTQVSSEKPAKVTIGAIAETDGNADGKVAIAVDESGGTTADYTLPLAFVSAVNGAGATQEDTTPVHIPAGAQYQLVNDSDPAGANTVETVRELVLG